jgi:putative spermidine/putrescine transport system substrate-binding protein
MSRPTAGRVTRGELLQRGGALVAGAAGLGVAPAALGSQHSSRAAFDGTLRILGIGTDHTSSLEQRAEQELGFAVAYDVTDPDSLVERAITQPGSFDVLSYFHFGYDAIWPTGSLAAVDTRRIARWDEVSPLFKLGKVRPGDAGSTYGQGDAPFRTMYVDGSRRYPVARDKPAGRESMHLVQWIDERTGEAHRGLPEPAFVAGVPTVFNVDAIGYNTRAIDRRPEQVSWAELLNRRWRGRVALFGGAHIGFQDTALAAEAQGLMRFRDKGDMTRAELDRLTKILIAQKRAGQFHGFWTFGPEVVDWMRSGDVVVEAMWAAHVVELRRQGFPVRYAAPPEGFRGWSGSLSISSAVQDPARLDAAYGYINWQLSGFAGAEMMRFGYYSAVQGPTRRHVDPAEWAYWIGGRPAAKALPGPFGDVTIRQGEVRDGGSFRRRARRFASWISIFRQRAHQERRWQEFLAA